jgi:molecular chaperone DnaK (HSP70)
VTPALLVFVGQAESLVYQSEKQLKEFEAKIPAETKSSIEAGIKRLKEAVASDDLEAMKKASEALNTSLMSMGQAMYSQVLSMGQAMYSQVLSMGQAMYSQVLS